MDVVEFTVSGRVQGVGFRYFTCTIAHELGIRGWVKNLPDGQVRILACADAQAMAAFRTKLRVGPAFSRVDALHERPHSGEPDQWTGFRVAY